MDRLIKVLTAVKLLIQIALYGVMLGALIWFLADNPLPRLIEQIQRQMM